MASAVNETAVVINNDNVSSPMTSPLSDEEFGNWIALLLGAMVVAGVVGNGLVCAAIAVERKLRNDTNYFLVSLAVADLFVSLVVMPCCIVQEFMGN